MIIGLVSTLDAAIVVKHTALVEIRTAVTYLMAYAALVLYALSTSDHLMFNWNLLEHSLESILNHFLVSFQELDVGADFTDSLTDLEYVLHQELRLLFGCLAMLLHLLPLPENLPCDISADGELILVFDVIYEFSLALHAVLEVYETIRTSVLVEEDRAVVE